MNIRLPSILLAGLLLSALPLVHAQVETKAQPAATPYAKPEDAEGAISRAEQGKRMVEQQFQAEQRACYQKFMVTDCIDSAKDRRRMQLRELNRTEVEARAWLRKNKVVERDRALEEKRIEDERDAKECEQEVKDREAALARRQQESARKVSEAAARPADVPNPRIAEQERKQQARAAQEAAEAPMRAKNVERYRQKQVEAQQRLRDAAERRAKREQELKQKQAAQQEQERKAQAATGASAAGVTKQTDQ